LDQGLEQELAAEADKLVVVADKLVVVAGIQVVDHSCRVICGDLCRLRQVPFLLKIICAYASFY
jgi:hypothetical protein